MNKKNLLLILVITVLLLISISIFIIPGVLSLFGNNSKVNYHYTKTSKVFNITDNIVLEDRYTEGSFDEVRAEYIVEKSTNVLTNKNVILCTADDFKEFYLNEEFLAVVSNNKTVFVINIKDEQLTEKYSSTSEFYNNYNNLFDCYHLQVFLEPDSS